MKLIGAKRQSRRGKKGARTSCADSLNSDPKGESLKLQVPASLDSLTVVVVNGVPFYREGHERIVTRVAPIKYGDDLFKEVDELCTEGSKQTKACIDVAERHGFSIEGFARQYRDRWLNRKMQKGEGTE